MTRKSTRWQQAPALAVSLVALFAALTGAAAALPGTQTVNSGDIKNNNVKSIDLKDGAAVQSADVIDETLLGLDVKDGEIASADVKDQSLTGGDVQNASLTGDDVQDNSLTGNDVAEATLGQVPNAATLNGRTPASFLSSGIYKKESAVAAGTTLGDGTQVLSVACDAGDVLLSGGPANIDAATDLLESFPQPGTTNGWQARVNKNGQGDNFSVVILCANQ